MRIDLNADVGEGYDDEPLLGIVTSVNIACGGHAGDAETMRLTVERARALGLAIGAHPSYPDRGHFGRRELDLGPSEIEEIVVAQVGALVEIAARSGARVGHVKPHGALYNQAAREEHVAQAIVGAIVKLDAALGLVGLSGSALVKAGREAGLTTFEEAFTDRRYRADRTLAPRSLAGSVVTDPAAAAAQALAIVRGEPIAAIDGQAVTLAADTLCLHGDTPGAAAMARAVRARLVEAGVTIESIGLSPLGRGGRRGLR